MESCIFCKIIARKIHAQILYEDNKTLIILDAFPASQGQTLVIPKKHVSYIFNMEEEEYTDLFLKAKKIAEAIEKTLTPIRTCIVVEGFAVDHVHIRLHPCYEKHLNLKPIEPRPSQEELEKIEKKIKSALK